MADIHSLSKARKAKAKADKDVTAEANRLKFGRTKAEKQRVAAERALRHKAADAHKRDRT